MLERIVEIQGIGLLHQANGKPYGFQKATLIYADNGRGKSTIATILRSISTANPSLIVNCKTVDGTLAPKVVLQFDGGRSVSFDNGLWSEHRSELLIFDADFIGRNVHSGGAVSTDHRKNLLEFALGESAVIARVAVEKATIESRLASEKVQNLLGQLAPHHVGITREKFEQLPEIPDVDVKIQDIEKRISAASNVVTIQARPTPSAPKVPSFDIDELFTTLGLSLKDVHANAETTVKRHIAKLGGRGAESWLSQGQQFKNGESCPFCDQDISTNDLVKAYQTHFNRAYAELKTKVSTLQSTAAVHTADSVVNEFAQNVIVAAAQATTWAEQVPTLPITFDIETARARMTELRECVTELVQTKATTPAEPCGTQAEREKVIALWGQMMIPIESARTAINTAETLISDYKTKLEGENVGELKNQRLQLHLAKYRYQPALVKLLGDLAAARKELELAEQIKVAARTTLDSLMTTVLGKYQSSINTLLMNFGASFRIKGMSANFRGHAPRSEYGLSLRGKDVSLEGGPPSFTTVLSDGDKRTLAFAFFVASTLDDPKLMSRTVIIDDPMCSLDINRRHHTQAVLRSIYAKSAQLVVLAHDAYFLRDTRNALKKADKSAAINVFQLIATTNDYTDFAAIDIDKECESLYAQHHRLLTQYHINRAGDPKAVAMAIRPMLEGYLHRRFPGLLPKDQMFGHVLPIIRDAVPPNPLCYAQNLVDVLNEINDYAGKFHHNTNPDADSVKITATELATYVNSALTVVHKGAPL